QEFGPSAAPLLVAGPDVGHTNIQKAGNLIGVHRGTKRHGGFIVGWAATDIHYQPTIGNLENGGFATAHNMASENALIKLRGAFHIGYSQEVSQDKAFFRRQLIVFSVAHGFFLLSCFSCVDESHNEQGSTALEPCYLHGALLILPSVPFF